jgi:RNA polymerase sigma-70 factor (ECF subfamily)
MSQSPNEPVQLIARARQGDTAALGKLLENYRSYLAILARLQIGRRLQGKVDPADLVQEAFLQAHRSFAQFQGTTEGEFMAWLRQTLVTRLANVVRHYATRARDVRLERDLAVELDKSSHAMDRGLVMATSSSPSQRAARREQAVLLADALERLSNDYREVMILHHLEGLTFPEVARRMGAWKSFGLGHSSGCGSCYVVRPSDLVEVEAIGSTVINRRMKKGRFDDPH